MKFTKIALVFVWMTAFSGLIGAADGVLNTRFKGWIGKNQKGIYLDASSWHYCFSQKGGSCGSKSLTTGRSKCTSNGFDIGASWSPPKVSGMSIAGKYSRSWSACNIRSETITCSPNAGYKGRAVVNFSKRWGRVHVLGGDTYLTLKSSCPAGWRSDWQGGSRWRCTYVGAKNYDRDGYLPEWRGSSCQYNKI